jgi:hypothetical protein
LAGSQGGIADEDWQAYSTGDAGDRDGGAQAGRLYEDRGSHHFPDRLAHLPVPWRVGGGELLAAGRFVLA